MWILGLTGALGAGKSTLDKYLRFLGVPVHCADREIHLLLQEDPEVKQKIKALWPSVFVNKKIDRQLLGNKVLYNSSELTKLEGILYPKLAKKQKKFLLANQKMKSPIVVLDVPLLFETGLDRYCHFVILATAPPFLRKQRALERKGMEIKKFQAFESHQLKDRDRKKGATFIISSGREKGSALRRIHQIIDLLLLRPPVKWQGKWPAHFKRELYGQRNRFRHGNNRV